MLRSGVPLVEALSALIEQGEIDGIINYHRKQYSPNHHATKLRRLLDECGSDYHLSLDLKAPEGKKLLRELAAKADVMVENFAPGT